MSALALSKASRELLAAERRAPFFALLKHEHLPRPTHEFVFDATRKWRLDYAWVEQRLALEVEGGIWTNGRHIRGAGFLRDISKYNRLACLGWRLLRCTPDSLTDEWTIAQIRDALTVKLS
jgi:hypothetical protein